MKILREVEHAHPILRKCISRINTDIIYAHNVPMKIFEIGRTHERHQKLISMGKTKNLLSRHLFNLDNDPPLYSTAIDYVYYDGRWSWNLRDSTILNWYILFGNLVLDICPELEWGGKNRKATNYQCFQLRKEIIENNLSKYNCVVPR
jgi:hypothetical protein